MQLVSYSTYSVAFTLILYHSSYTRGACCCPTRLPSPLTLYSPENFPHGSCLGNGNNKMKLNDTQKEGLRIWIQYIKHFYHTFRVVAVSTLSVTVRRCKCVTILPKKKGNTGEKEKAIKRCENDVENSALFKVSHQIVHETNHTEVANADVVSFVDIVDNRSL